jgi:hypothetical protein
MSASHPKKQRSMTEKIYIHMIDGTDVWVPANAVRQTDNQFLIQTFDDFDPDDTSVIPQFIPGDVVICKPNTTKGIEFETAQSLIKPSDNKDKNYIEFLYKTATGDKLESDNERIKYKDAITRTRKEIKDGKFHYPAIVDYITGIETV